MSNDLFISYSRADMEDEDWLARLRKHLGFLEQRLAGVEIWDDRRITPGQEWRQEIDEALWGARAAVLLVGPGFLGSDFVMKHELPSLLKEAETRGTKILPVVVAHCGWEFSALEPYQACYDPSHPLESLERKDQNKFLSEVAKQVYTVVQEARLELIGDKRIGSGLVTSMKEIDSNLKYTRNAFIAQCQRRNDLHSSILDRLGVRSDLEYEKFFFRHYPNMNDSERFEFDQIRAITEGPLKDGNRRILEILDSNPQLLDEVPYLIDLRQHLAFWLSKFDRVFSGNKAMCVLYVGVEDGVPFPAGIDQAVSTWLSQQ